MKCGNCYFLAEHPFGHCMLPSIFGEDAWPAKHPILRLPGHECLFDRLLILTERQKEMIDKVINRLARKGWELQVVPI